MTQIEQIVLLITIGGWALTFVKISHKHTKWYWNLAPALIGATTMLWIARIFG